MLLSLCYFFFDNILRFIEDITEFKHQQGIHIVYEILINIIAIIAIYIVVKDNYFQRKTVVRLQQSINNSNIENTKFIKQIQILKKDLLHIINTQFNEWGLSKSEQEVALLLLKGLSLEEISLLRNTKERTARQQASIIYKKSNLKGRHELAAYFFEDLL